MSHKYFTSYVSHVPSVERRSGEALSHSSTNVPGRFEPVHLHSHLQPKFLVLLFDVCVIPPTVGYLLSTQRMCGKKTYTIYKLLSLVPASLSLFGFLHFVIQHLLQYSSQANSGLGSRDKHGKGSLYKGESI